MLVFDPVSDASSAAAKIWLRRLVDDEPEKKNGHAGSSTNNAGLTASEAISIKAQASMVGILLAIDDQTPGSGLDSASAVKDFSDDLLHALELQKEHVSEIKDDSLAARETLNSLYNAYELGTTAIKFIAYLSNAKQNVYNTKEETSVKTIEAAKGLLQTVVEKSTAVKKGLDESGWIDRVLESVSRGEQASADEPKAIADTLKGMIDENFMEEWAGHILESWRDSVIGFSFFKTPKA
jgi:N-terminal acetyltransferase B complex non-catalytic subunit